MSWPCNWGDVGSGTSRQGLISNESWRIQGIQGSSWKIPCKRVHQTYQVMIWGTPVFFIHKKDGTLKMCVDYKTLNKVMVKNWYPWFRIDNLFDRLLKVKVFSKIDLICSRYYQIRIVERDKEKIVCRTRYSSYEFLMMPFEFTNALATFCTFMNDIFWEWLNDFVVIYIYDILVHSNFMEEHVEHLWKVFQRLKENKLYVKFKKCKFKVMEVDSLGHKITQEGLKMDDHKVKAILD